MAQMLGYSFRMWETDSTTFAAAREERLKVSGAPRQYDDLGVFLREQDLLREMINQSSLMALEVDVSDDDVDRAADAAEDRGARLADFVARGEDGIVSGDRDYIWLGPRETAHAQDFLECS